MCHRQQLSYWSGNLSHKVLLSATWPGNISHKVSLSADWSGNLSPNVSLSAAEVLVQVIVHVIPEDPGNSSRDMGLSQRLNFRSATGGITRQTKKLCLLVHKDDDDDNDDNGHDHTWWDSNQQTSTWSYRALSNSDITNFVTTRFACTQNKRIFEQPFRM